MRTILLILLAVLIISMPKIVHAQSDFSLAFDASYVFNEDGKASVTKRITLTNLNTNTYPSVYLVDVPDDATTVAAFNEKGKLEVKSIQEAGRKMARITLSDQNVGMSQESNITLTFDTALLSHLDNGNWQILIPPFTADEHVISYNTSVSTPAAWGNPAYTAPHSGQEGKWTMEEQGEESIVMMYGVLPTQPHIKNGSAMVSTTLVIIGVIGGLLVTAILFFVYNKRFKIQ